MRTIVLFFLLAAFSPLAAQKVLQIEKFGSPKTEKIFIGQPISYRLQGEKGFRLAYIEGFRIEDSLIVLGDRYVNVYDIKALRFERNWPRAARSMLFWFGIGWSGFAAIGTATDGNPDSRYRWPDAIVSATSLSLSYAILPIFRYKTIRLGKRHRLRLLDLNFKKEAWED